MGTALVAAVGLANGPVSPHLFTAFHCDMHPGHSCLLQRLCSGANCSPTAFLVPLGWVFHFQVAAAM